jgi:hypothetical protein
MIRISWQTGLTAYFSLLSILFVLQYALVPTVEHYRTNRRANEVFDVADAQPYFFVLVFSLLPIVVAVYVAVHQLVSDWSRRAMVFIGVVFSLVLYVLVMSRWSLLCDYNQRDMDRICEYTDGLLERFRDDPNVGPKAVWVSNGTLIAMMRNESTNRMLLNDHDMDFCFLISKLDAILEVAERHGYFYRYLKIQQYHFLRFWPAWSELQTGHSGVPTVDMEACKAEELMMARGCNDHMWPVPVKFDEILSNMFGANWRTPIDANHWVACAVFRGLGSL